MTDHDDSYALALAYVYGELGPAEVKSFEARLETDAELRAEVEGLVATRDLLDMDVRYGEESGRDVPPPHLTDAILRAEALARPREIREAAIAASGQTRTWVQRLSVWLIGGGVAVGAAATLLVLVTSNSMMKESADMAAAPAPAASADAESAPRFEPAKPMAKSAPNGAMEKSADFADEKPAEAFEESKKERAADGFAPSRDPSPRSSGRQGEAGEDRAGAKDRSRSLVFNEPADAPMKQAAPKPSQIAGGKAFDYAEGEAEEEPLAELAADEADADDNALGDSFGAGGASSKADGIAPMEPAPPPPATRAPAGPPKVGSNLRKVLERGKKAPSKRKAKKRAVERDARSQMRAEAKGQLEQNERLTAINVAYRTAERAFNAGRFGVAYDEYGKAGALDAGGKVLGPMPHVGQMRSLHSLGRYREVLDHVPALMRFGVKIFGVADGLLVAADAAERLGQLDRAERLYADAAKSPDVKLRTRAKKASKRMRARREMDMEAPAAAAEAPE
jgi:hypothetical protein